MEIRKIWVNIRNIRGNIRLSAACCLVSPPN